MVAMFLLDDILLFPVHGLYFIAREIHKAAVAEIGDTRSVIQELQELHMLLETGRLSEDEFARQEAVLLDRLDEAEKHAAGG